MDGWKVQALNLGARDYGENDKLITLCTHANGTLSALMKGVKKAGAKMKFAAQPFCFGEYVLSRRGDFYLVTGCTSLVDFRELSERPESFFAGCCVLEICGLFVQRDQQTELLPLTLRALEALCNRPGQDLSVLVAYLHGALALAGYGVDPAFCQQCGGSTAGRVRFSERRGIVCPSCGGGRLLDQGEKSILGALCTGDPEAFYEGGFAEADLKAVLRMLCNFVYLQTDHVLKSVKQYLNLV